MFFSSWLTAPERWMSPSLCAAINVQSVFTELPKVSNFSAFIENLILRGRHTGAICDIKNGLEAASDKIFSVDERDVELWGLECINAFKKGLWSRSRRVQSLKFNSYAKKIYVYKIVWKCFNEG